MEIHLIRHGPAGRPDDARFPDDDARPLTPKGRKAWQRAARGLRAQGAAPGRILASPALRTRQSAAILADELGSSAKTVLLLDDLHHGSRPAGALARLARMRLPGRVALVGHQPWLGEFLSLLLSGHARMDFRWSKGGVCLLEAEAWKPGAGRLIWFCTQDQLTDLGGR